VSFRRGASHLAHFGVFLLETAEALTARMKETYPFPKYLPAA
jgi:hypothetical protein